MLKLTDMLELPFPICINKKQGEILIFRNFIAKFWIFAYFTQKVAIKLNFQARRVFMTS